MENIIEVKDLVKRYRKADKNAVDGISFEVKKGEFFAFLGPNGAGKTTTISILTTILSKTRGTVKIVGHDADKEAARVRQEVGIIFQNPSLDLNLSAEENVRFHAFLYNVFPFKPAYSLMPEEYKKKVKELSEILGIGKEIFDPIKTFSGGMKRKLEIIRSLIHSPKVLFLDEPTVGLDPASRKSLWEYLDQVRKKEKITVFLTTHYLEETENCDHICIINHGKVIALGTPEKIKRDLAQNTLLLDSDERAKLVKELEALNAPYTPKDEFIEVDVKDINIQKLIASIHTPLTVIRTHTPTLEEAYLSLIDNPEEAEEIAV